MASGSSKIFGKDWVQSLPPAVFNAWRKYDEEIDEIATLPAYKELSRMQDQRLNIDYLVKMAFESGVAGQTHLMDLAEQHKELQEKYDYAVATLVMEAEAAQPPPAAVPLGKDSPGLGSSEKTGEEAGVGN